PRTALKLVRGSCNKSNGNRQGSNGAENGRVNFNLPHVMTLPPSPQTVNARWDAEDGRWRMENRFAIPTSLRLSVRAGPASKAEREKNLAKRGRSKLASNQR